MVTEIMTEAIHHDIGALLAEYAGKKVLVIGIGGGGDIVGTIPLAQHLVALGAHPVLAGLTWKRKSHDGIGRPRRRDEFVGCADGNDVIWLVTKDTRLRDELVINGSTHIESAIARNCEYDVAAINPTKGSKAITAGLLEFIAQQHIDDIIGIDIGGDMLCNGDESTLRSPICDQVMLRALSDIDNTIVGVSGLGTDGEITLQDFSTRFETLKHAYLGAKSAPQSGLDTLASLLGQEGIHTECSRKYCEYSLTQTEDARKGFAQSMNARDVSAFIKKCVSGVTIESLRGGQRASSMSALTTLTLFFNPKELFTSSMLSKQFSDTDDIFSIGKKFQKVGVQTELTEEN